MNNNPVSVESQVVILLRVITAHELLDKPNIRKGYDANVHRTRRR